MVEVAGASLLQRPIAVFRCDASLQIGTGHVMRCLTLAGALRESHEIYFLTGQETLKAVPALAASGFTIIDTAPSGADLLIVDHYDLDETYERQARNWARRIMVIDDLANRRHDCDILLDQTLGRSESDYTSLVPKACKILCGPSFALLRPEFSGLRKTLKRSQRRPDRILVSFGGVNPKRSTQLALEMLERFREWPLVINVVMGAQADGLEEIKNLVRLMSQNGPHKVSLHVNTHGIAKLMAENDLCLGAGGTTSWERCCLGLPTITLELAENQKAVLQGLSSESAVINVGPIESANAELLLITFSDLVKNPARLAEIGEKAKQICDGRGAERMVPYMIVPECAKDGKFVTIRLMDIADCEQLFTWQNNKEIRKFSRNPAVPGRDEHIMWFETSLANPDRQLFMIEYGARPAGMARLDRVQGDDNVFEVSILIDPAFHNLGIGLAALTLLRKLKPDSRLKAEVLPGNTASQKLFEKAGYKAVSDTWYECGR